MGAVAVKHMTEIFQAAATVLVADDQAALGAAPLGAAATTAEPFFNLALARRVIACGKPETGSVVYMPLRGSERIKGVLLDWPASAIAAAEAAA
jgi:hypothetical protein